MAARSWVVGELDPLFTLRVRLADLIELADDDRERGEGARGMSCVDFLLATLRSCKHFGEDFSALAGDFVDVEVCLTVYLPNLVVVVVVTLVVDSFLVTFFFLSTFRRCSALPCECRIWLLEVEALRARDVVEEEGAGTEDFFLSVDDLAVAFLSSGLSLCE